MPEKKEGIQTESRRKFIQTIGAGVGTAFFLPVSEESQSSKALAQLSDVRIGLIARPTSRAPQAAPWTSIYVSPKGNDGNPATEEKPVATIQKARDVVRTTKKAAKVPIEVVLLPGSYYLGQSLSLGPEDSGTREAPIVYRAAEEGTVTISGGTRLKCDWKSYENGIFVCDVPEAKAGKLNFSELYVNGRRQIRARYPNGDSRIPQPAGCIGATGADKWPHKEMYFDPETFTEKQWAHPEEAVVFAFQRTGFNPVPFWSGQWHVRGIDRTRNAILLGEGGHQQLLFHYMQAYQPGIYPNMPFYVENVFEELDDAGEWYLDRREGKLYYKPGDGVDLKSAVVEPALIQRVVQIKGTRDNPVKYITLRGLRIAHAASTYFEPYSPAGMGDYTIQVGGAVFIEGAEDVTVDRCSFEGVSGNGFFVNRYARRVRLTNSRLVDIGESGICFVGRNIYREDKHFKCPVCGFNHWWGWDPETDEIPMDCEASNNLVHDVGEFAKQCAAVFMANCQRVKIVHDHIYNAPRAGINVNNGRYGGHVFEFNDVHDTVRETADHGPFNSYGREPYWCQHVCHTDCVPQGYPRHLGDKHHSFGSFEEICKYARETTIIRNNRFSATRLGGNPRPGLQFGIDLDDGSANYDVYNNLCVDMGVKTKEGSFIKIHDNTTINGDIRLGEANRDNHVVVENNTTLGSASSSIDAEYARVHYMKGLQFGVTADFPQWLR
jgi:hypothetical protein